MTQTNLDFRPGLAFGGYPEKPVEHTENVEKIIKHLTQRFQAKRVMPDSELDDVVNKIEQAGQPLKSMPDDVLDMSIQGLKLRLQRKDADPKLAIQAFAHIREVADRVLGLRHFPSQIKGGWVIYNGMLAEMQTGEGKTLTATLPASAAAMAGIPVHVITSNDYLAERDAEEMMPVYKRLGLTVGSIKEEMDSDQRIAAYRCDITYCTNKQIAFDYLRDRVARGNATSPTHMKLHKLYGEEASKLLLSGLCYAIVDEADSVLIDEARTPLILSNQIEGGDDPETYTQALELAAQLSLDVDFILHKQLRSTELTESGCNKLEQLSETLPVIWHARRRREELVQHALVAMHVFIRDRDYLVKDNKVQIIDGYTGRLMPDRSWEKGLHQMVEVKEGCEISGDKETLARISYQRFFRRYLKLGGMTGTTKNIELELATTYNLPVVRIPTNKKNIRKTIRPRTFVSEQQKIQAAIASIKKFHNKGRPVLIGTRSVESSEKLGVILQEAGIDCKIVNARQDATEAEVVASAGQVGAVTVATNMAGRGTDIKLSDEAKKIGGLHVIITERNEASRIDRQLIGRCSRQGDPGSYQVYTSINDEIPCEHYSLYVRRLLSVFAFRKGEFPRKFGNWLIDQAQEAMERKHARARKALVKQDEKMGDLLAFSGSGE